MSDMVGFAHTLVEVKLVKLDGKLRLLISLPAGVEGVASVENKSWCRMASQSSLK